MKRNENNETGSSKPVDQEFWDFLTEDENQKILIMLIRQKLSNGGIESPEDIISRIKEKYSQEGACRPCDLHRGTLSSFAKRQVIDYKRGAGAQKRGSGVAHVSLDDHEYQDWLPSLSVDPIVLEISPTMEVLMSGLEEAASACDGKQLVVVRALLRWLEGGCRSESWCDELAPNEVREFRALKKGKSLEGKASATFSQVKKILREILVEQGFREI